jgi:hypothetical protein
MEFGLQVQQVAQELLTAGPPRSLSDMERKIRQALLRIGQFLLGAWLLLQEGPYPEREIPCRCGGQARYERKREGVLFTILGVVHYKRAYYVCPHCHEGTYPLDEQLGLRPGALSAELEELLGKTGAQLPFQKGSDLFTDLTLVEVSPQSMNKATEEMGEEMMRVEKEWLAASQDALALTRQARATPTEERLYVALDAVKVHTEERQTAEDDGWRDLKVGAWFRTAAPPPEQPQEDWDIQAQDLTYFCDFAEAKTFGQLLWATGVQREALRTRELVFLGDGAEWIWNLAQEHFPQAVQIVDWFHAAEHLGVVAKAVFKEHAAQEAWLATMREFLWQGEVHEVMQTCAALAERGPGAEEARQAATYFRNHGQRMDYAAYRAKGYQIGSGTIESACKQLGLQRMKVPGATWSLEGARRTAKARAALLSDQWELLVQRREHLPRAA